MPDGGFHARGGGRCRCTHVAVSIRLSSGARRGCRCARRASARTTGMQERGQLEWGRRTGWERCDAPFTGSLTGNDLTEAGVKFAAEAKTPAG
ncbi:hypothetical protein CFB40_26220 [Burkholderia sp. AU31652]|nr:hypothetical protein CFB40_26220 [Burkholderia sp. AU31652]